MRITPSPDISLRSVLETTSRQFSEVQAPGNAAVLHQLTDGPCRRPNSHGTPSPLNVAVNSLPKPLLDHRLPRHQPESQTIVQHGKAPADEHHAAPVDPTDALAIGRCYKPVSAAMVWPLPPQTPDCAMSPADCAPGSRAARAARHDLFIEQWRVRCLDFDRTHPVDEAAQLLGRFRITTQQVGGQHR